MAPEAETGGRTPSLAGRRHQARHYLIQALYRQHMTGESAGVLRDDFLAEYNFAKTDTAYFRDALAAVLRHTGELDAQMQPFLDREPEALGPVERAILRLGTWELSERSDIPFRVVLDEAVGLARKFGATDSHKYVNAVLDKVARRCRPAEFD
jgi:N utilization substance protein B